MAKVKNRRNRNDRRFAQFLVRYRREERERREERKREKQELKRWKRAFTERMRRHQRSVQAFIKRIDSASTDEIERFIHCGRKIPYRDLEEIRRALQMHPNWDRSLQSYSCPLGRHFHLGNPIRLIDRPLLRSLRGKVLARKVPQIA